MSVEAELQNALADGDRYDALAFVDMTNDHLLFLRTVENAPRNLAPALEKFLLRVLTDTESHDQFTRTEEIIFYDIEGRQVICTPLVLRRNRYLLTMIVAPGKSYKQASKRLLKNLKSLLETR